MSTFTPAYTQIASGLRFPEGSVAMPDGSVVLVEIERRTHWDDVEPKNWGQALLQRVRTSVSVIE